MLTLLITFLVIQAGLFVKAKSSPLSFPVFIPLLNIPSPQPFTLPSLFWFIPAKCICWVF